MEREEETPNGVVAVSAEMDLSCSLCAQAFDGGSHFPMMICPQQHSCCQQCIHRFVFPLRAKPPQPPDPDERISTCPFCRATIHLDAVRKFRVLDELRIALEKAKRQSREGYSTLQQINVQLKGELQEERRVRLNLSHQMEIFRQNTGRQKERLRMEAQNHEQNAITLKRKLREKEEQIEEMEKEFQMREEGYLQQRARKKQQIDAVREDKQTISELMRQQQEVVNQLQERVKQMEREIKEKERNQNLRQLETRQMRKEACIYRGELAFRKCKWKEATKHFMQVIVQFGEELICDSPQGWGCIEDLKDVTPPYSIYYFIKSANTLSTSIFDMLGICLVVEDIHEAKEWLREQVRRLKFWQLRLLLAHVLYNSKEYAQAKQAYEQAYQVKKHWKASEVLGWTELAMGNKGEARRWGLIAQKAAPRQISVTLLLILAEETEEKKSKLINLYRLHPQFYRAAYELAHLLYKSHLKQDYEHAMQLLQKVPHGCYLHEGSLLLAGQIHYAHEEYHQALISFSLSVNCKAKAVDGYFWLGNIELKQKRFELALNCYRLCLQNNPRHHEALYNMGMAKYQTGDLLMAEQMYLECKEVKEDFYLAYYGMARVRVAQGDHEAALMEIEKCLEYKPGYEYAEKIKKQLVEQKKQAERTRLRENI